jgi:U3 small nucleolar RNA-associated protein 18
VWIAVARSPLPLQKLVTDPCNFFSVRRTSIFATDQKLRQFHNNTKMPPKTKTAHRANGGERFQAPKTKSAKLTESDDERDATAGALQPTTAPKEPEWEGFGEEDDEDSSEVSEEDEEEDEEEESEDDIPHKDEEEEALERLVFGDAAGFKEGIKAFSLDPLAAALGESSDEEKEEEDEDLENVADQDLFFFDSGPTAAPATTLTLAEDEEEEEGAKPAWEDSDDDRLVVSLASVPQLRKLREDEEDDMVNGKEYVRRLRKQYTRLYPTPEWALKATGKTKRKRTRTTEDGESGEDSASDMDVDEEDLSTQPLARLMKDADILSRHMSRNPAKRRKLQAGTIDIQRLKDVCKSGPVCVFSLLPINAVLINSATVRSNISLFPSYIPTYSFLRPKLNTISPPYQPKPSKPESAPHLPPHQENTTYDNRLPSIT